MRNLNRYVHRAHQHHAECGQGQFSGRVLVRSKIASLSGRELSKLIFFYYAEHALSQHRLLDVSTALPELQAAQSRDNQSL